MRRLICLLALAMLASGCATMYTTRVNQLKSISLGITSDEVQKELGKPIKSEYVGNNVSRHTYASFHWGNLENKYFWAYFKDSKLVRVSECGFIKTFTELNDLYALGIISREEYQIRHQKLVQRGMMIAQFMQAMPYPAYQSYQPPKRQPPKRHTIYGPVHENGNIHYKATGYIEGDTIYGATKRDGNIHYGPAGYIVK